MPGKPQTLSKGQQEEVANIFKKKILAWIIIGLAILTGITGYSLRGIKNSLEKRLEYLVAKQFDEPKIQEVVNNAAETKSKQLLTQKIDPEIEKFTENLSNQQLNIDKFIAETKSSLTVQANDLKEELENAKTQLYGVESDLAKIKKGIIAIEYYKIKGRNKIPNPYDKKILEILNELLLIAEPNPKKQAKFIKELESYELK